MKQSSFKELVRLVLGQPFRMSLMLVGTVVQVLLTVYLPILIGQAEKATLFCTIFIKCFLLSGHSLSDGCLIIETTVNAMMIPPVDIVLGFKG